VAVAYSYRMAAKYREMTQTEAVRNAQGHYYGRAQSSVRTAGPDVLTEDETDFIQSRDSFYMATVNVDGWPYIQHRGGHPGFLNILGPNRLAFADFRGNRQLLSTGNLAGSEKVALFLMDYPNRTRLKILGHARVEDACEHADLIEKLAAADERSLVERLFFIDVVSYDWNCPQHITPRFTIEKIQSAIAPLKKRIAELEAQIKK